MGDEGKKQRRKKINAKYLNGVNDMMQKMGIKREKS